MTEHVSAVTIVKQGHANWVVLASFFVGSWVGAIVALALVIVRGTP
jgi:hypothetical protein